MPTGCKRSVQVLLEIHLFNDLFSGTTWASRYQKSKNSLDFKDMNEAKDHVVLGWQWHQLNHMQTMCTSLQTDNHINTSSLNFYRPGPWHRHSIFTGQMLFLMPNQQCQNRNKTVTKLTENGPLYLTSTEILNTARVRCLTVISTLLLLYYQYIPSVL